MSALRKPAVLPPSLRGIARTHDGRLVVLMSVEERASWDAFVKSLAPKKPDVGWVPQGNRLDHPVRIISDLDPTIWGGSRGRYE